MAALRSCLLLLAAAVCVVLQPFDARAGINKNEQNNNTRGFLSFLFGGPRQCNCICGQPNRAGRLINGEYTQSHEFPWLVAVIANGSQVTTGALINDRYVLTSNAPLRGMTPFDVKVTLGANDRCVPDISSVNDSVSSITVLPNYDPRTGSPDLALLKLTNPVSFNRNINPICLPEPNARYLGQVVTVGSYSQEQNTSTAAGNVETTTTSTTTTTTPAPAAAGGRRRRRFAEPDFEEQWMRDLAEDNFWTFPHKQHRTRRQGSLDTGPCQPKKLGIPVLGEGRCPEPNVNAFQITGDTGCAGVSGAFNQVCLNDTGSPVMFRDQRGIYQLVGVLNGNNNCSERAPALYTRVNNYVNWIYGNTQGACYCSPPFRFGF